MFNDSKPIEQTFTIGTLNSRFLTFAKLKEAVDKAMAYLTEHGGALGLSVEPGFDEDVDMFFYCRRLETVDEAKARAQNYLTDMARLQKEEYETYLRLKQKYEGEG